MDRRIEALIEAGAVSAADAEGHTVEDLLRNGVVSEADYLRVISKAADLPIYEFNGDGPFPEGLLPVEVAQKHRAVVVGQSNGQTTVAMADPFELYAKDDLRFLFGEVDLRVADPRMVTAALHALPHPEPVSIDEVFDEFAETELDEDPNPLHVTNDLDQMDGPALGQLLTNFEANETGIVVRLVHALLLAGSRLGASELAIEPGAGGMKIRMRLRNTGEWSDPGWEFPRLLVRPLAARVKIIAGLDVAERRLPQFGAVKFTETSGIAGEVKISTLPTVEGEEILLQFPLRDVTPMAFDDLGLPDDIIEGLDHAVASRRGIIFVGSRRESGATTTLHALADHYRTPADKLMIVEEVEPLSRPALPIPDAARVRCNASIGMYGASAVRATLMHRPTMLLVDTMPDFELLNMLIDSAMRGMLIFANMPGLPSAQDAITRILNMGAEEELVAATVHGALVQRLVRLTCPSCETAGCAECFQTGYRGRRAVFAAWFSPDDALRTAALKLAEEGLTTRAEAIRATPQ